MITSELDNVEFPRKITRCAKSRKLTRLERARRKKIKRRRILFFVFSFILIITTVFILKFSKKELALKSPQTALEYFMLDSLNPKLDRIDNSELIYSHENKSIYKVYGIDNKEAFKIYEIGLKKDSSNWSIDTLKTLN